ncbi:hypothetical protein [Paludibacter sp.]|uniref:hypothetical protein n=1 Tax=Paludibacter sp. TaxID=1898105 RepID=UPI001354B4E9|nr:hypothetical protein [Paludibacter sp.]MTK54030.1 hypothetical protein [Paludibacter sp.]
MLEDGINYEKTVENHRLVYKGQTYDVVMSRLFALIVIVTGLGISYSIAKDQIAGQPSVDDYIIAIIGPVVILIGTFWACKELLIRDQLKELEIHISTEKAKHKLQEAALNLHWDPLHVTDNYMMFSTRGVGSRKSNYQTITLIIFLDSRIYFNSVNTSLSDKRFQHFGFDANYKLIQEEYLRIEKE